MDEMVLEGRKFISARKAAEITGYEQDYIGQLARMGRVIGRQIGRAWYIEAESLSSHKAGGRKRRKSKPSSSSQDPVSTPQYATTPPQDAQVAKSSLVVTERQTPITSPQEQSGSSDTVIPIKISQQENESVLPNISIPEDSASVSVNPRVAEHDGITNKNIQNSSIPEIPLFQSELLTYIVENDEDHRVETAPVAETIEIKKLHVPSRTPTASDIHPLSSSTSRNESRFPIMSLLLLALFLSAVSFGAASVISETRIYGRSGAEFVMEQRYEASLEKLLALIKPFGVASTSNFLR